MVWRVAGPLSLLTIGLGALAGFIAVYSPNGEPAATLLSEPTGQQDGARLTPEPSPLPSSVKLVALDAGHGGEDTGATYPVDAGTDEALLFEKDLNLAVIQELASLLEADTDLRAVLTRETDEFILARERVDVALDKCESQFGRACDLYLSVHHNGFEESLVDGPQVLFDEESDILFATSLHDRLSSGLSFPPEACSYGYLYTDYGLTQEDFGLPVHEGLISATTEAYFFTNDCEADHHLSGAESFTVCDDAGGCRTVTLGARVQDEATAIYDAIASWQDRSQDDTQGKRNDG